MAFLATIFFCSGDAGSGLVVVLSIVMAATQSGIRLATYLIASHFGDPVSKVCECLLLKGSLNLSQIVTYTGLCRPDVQKYLLVLIQHNCIQPFTLEQNGGFGEENKHTYQYTPLFTNIMHRMRFSKFLLLVDEKLGKECTNVLQGLLEHGRLTMEQIIKRAEADGLKASHATVATFEQLVSAHFVERCPESDPQINLPTAEETTSKNRRSKLAKVIPQTIEQRAIAEAIPMEAKRFRVAHGHQSHDTEETKKDISAVLSSGQKRKREFSEIEDEPEAASFQKEVLWRPNYEEFVRFLRHKACIAYQRSRLDEKAAVVLSAMLEYTKGPESRVMSEYSATLSLYAIYEEVIKTEVGRAMIIDHVRASLIQLGCRKDGDDSYSIDLNNIIQQCRSEEVESVVLKRYGEVAHMIFRLLSTENRFLETGQVSEAVMTEKIETKATLFQLWKDNYLLMEKLSKERQQVVLWKVDKDMVWKQVLDKMHHAAYNLISRVSYEFNKEPELMEVPRSKLNEVLIGKRTRLFNIKLLMESSLMRLDDAIMLFHDF